MPQLKKYRVVREHFGDKPYAEGDERIGAAADLDHLVPRLLEEIGLFDGAAADVEPDGEKADPAPANKASPKPKNKAARGPAKAE